MSPPTDLEEVVNAEIKEWHFHIYFHQNNANDHHAALELRDAVLRLRRDGAFVAVPLFRVNTDPVGPHPVGSYEIWVPSISFAPVFSYLCQHRGNLSILVHPITREMKGQVAASLSSPRDHEIRKAWIGPSYPIDTAHLPVLMDEIPLQYPSLKLGYSAPEPDYTLEERRCMGANVERILRTEKEAARAPPN
ncbi:DOPA-like domain-containing protein [Melanogaster broomeanus]|nr:DOPA-like domain-containing protein [Melanogaster broomeanus]